MKKTDFYLMLDEIIDQDPGTIQGDETLTGLDGWDSLAIMSFIAGIDENFGVILEPRELADCQTVADLVNLVKNHIED